MCMPGNTFGFFSSTLKHPYTIMTVSPFSYAELDEAWGPVAPKPSVCDLAKNNVGTEAWMPKAFNDKLQTDSMVLPRAAEQSKRNLIETPTQERVHNIGMETLASITPPRQSENDGGVENFESARDLFVGMEKGSLVNLGLYTITGVLMVFVMDQFTKLGISMHRV